MRRFLKLRKKTGVGAERFSLHTIMLYYVGVIIKRSAKASGLNDEFSALSIRAGGAPPSASNAVAIDAIGRFGRWLSDPPADIYSVAIPKSAA